MRTTITPLHRRGNTHNLQSRDTAHHASMPTLNEMPQRHSGTAPQSGGTPQRVRSQPAPNLRTANLTAACTARRLSRRPQTPLCAHRHNATTSWYTSKVIVVESKRPDTLPAPLRRPSMGSPATNPSASRRLWGTATPAAAQPTRQSARRRSRWGNLSLLRRPHAGHASIRSPRRCDDGHASAQVRMMATPCRGGALRRPIRASATRRSRRGGGTATHRRSRGTHAATADAPPRRSKIHLRACARESPQLSRTPPFTSRCSSSARARAANIVSTMAGAAHTVAP